MDFVKFQEAKQAYLEAIKVDDPKLLQIVVAEYGLSHTEHSIYCSRGCGSHEPLRTSVTKSEVEDWILRHCADKCYDWIRTFSPWKMSE